MKATQRELGARVQALRRARRLSLREVAEAVDVSPSFLSLLERGQTDLSLTRFSRLADFFGVPVVELLADGNGHAPPSIHPAESAERVDRGEGVDYRVLRREHPQVVSVALAPGAEFHDLRTHGGEDIWMVASGRAEVVYGDERFPVEARQLISFSGLVPHGLANPHDEPALLFAICSVPYW